MIADYRKLASIVRGVWPELRCLWIPDTRFYLPTLEEMQTTAGSAAACLPLLRASSKTGSGEAFDCDDYALQMHGCVKRLRQGSGAPWAFGEVVGGRFRGVEGPHSLNLFVCGEDATVYLLEPQTLDSWKAFSEMDLALMVKF